MPSPLAVPADLLAALAGALARLRARWYVFGAQAVVLWGRPRLTADIDVTVRMDPEEPERLVEALAAAGFSVRIGAPPDFVRLTRVLPFVHDASGLPLDIVLAGPGLEELFLSRAVPVTIGDLAYPSSARKIDRHEDPRRPGEGPRGCPEHSPRALLQPRSRADSRYAGAARGSARPEPPAPGLRAGTGRRTEPQLLKRRRRDHPRAPRYRRDP